MAYQYPKARKPIGERCQAINRAKERCKHNQAFSLLLAGHEVKICGIHADAIDDLETIDEELEFLDERIAKE